MINIMLVAGEKTSSLSNFLEQRGTCSVDYAYNSLTEEIVAIRDCIINVDKLVYLLDKQAINIRVEMQLLKDLLTQEGFFTTREIIFLVTENVDTDKAIRYFQAVMQESNFTNYSINKTKAKVSFADIFDYIVGTTRIENFKNSFKNVYRVERNSDSNTAYVSHNDLDLTIEPFSYSHVAMYETAKLNSKRTESGVLHRDDDTGVALEQKNNPHLSNVDVVSNVTGNSQTFLVTGERKTGVSTWAVALSASCVSAGKKMMLLDFTENNDLEELLKSGNLNYTKIRMLDFIHNYSCTGNRINLVTTYNEEERTVRMEFLQHIFSNRNNLPDVIVIALPCNLCEVASTILINESSKVLYCINPIFNDVLEKQSLIELYSQQYDFYLILNNRIRLLDETSYLNKEKIESLLPFALRIIKEIDFPDLNIDDSLYRSLMEV